MSAARPLMPCLSSAEDVDTSSSLGDLDGEYLCNMIALKSVEQEPSDTLHRRESCVRKGSCRRSIKQDFKLNLVIVIASGDRMKEVMLEPPRVGRQGAKSPLEVVQPSHTTHQKLDLATGRFAPGAADQKRPLG